MKKALILLAACMAFSSCRDTIHSDTVSLAEVSRLVFDEGYSEADVLEMIRGTNYEDLDRFWGEHGELSGFWGDVWSIYDGEDRKQMIVYYDNNGYPIHVKIFDIEDNTEAITEQPENLETDEDGYYIDDDPPIWEEEWYLDDVLSLIGSKDEDYNSEAVLRMLTERDFHYEELHEHWGTPDAVLSGFWGDIWHLENNKKVSVYYNSNGYVENVIMDNVEDNTETITESSENLETDENGYYVGDDIPDMPLNEADNDTE